MNDSKEPQVANKNEPVELAPKHWYDLSLIQAVFVAVIVAAILVGVAQILYLHNNNHKYDISRPGNKYNPPQLSIGDDTSIDTQSPVSAKTLSDTTKMIQDQLNKLPPYGDYGDPALSSGSLDLTTPKAQKPTQP
jgi:hypothetical protein